MANALVAYKERQKAAERFSAPAYVIDGGEKRIKTTGAVYGTPSQEWIINRQIDMRPNLISYATPLNNIQQKNPST